MNNYQFSGRLTKDFTNELKSSQSGTSYLYFTIAVQVDKDRAVFLPCIAYGKTAEYIAKKAIKGKEVIGYGSLIPNIKEDGTQNGVKIQVIQAGVYDRVTSEQVNHESCSATPVEENIDPWDR